MGIDFGRAIGAPFKDPGWLMKTVLGGVWLFLSFITLGFVVFGQRIEYMRSVASGDEMLPELEFGGQWFKGLLVSLAEFIYGLPAVLIFMFSFVPIILGIFSQDVSGVAAGFGGSCIFLALGFVWMVLVSLIFFGAEVNYAMKGTFGSFFSFKDIMAKIRSDSGYWMAWLWSVVIYLGASAATGLVAMTFIGVLLAPFIYYLAFMMSAHVLGQYAARAYGMPGPGAVAAPAGYAPPAPAGSRPPAPPSVPAPPSAAPPTVPPAPPAPQAPPRPPGPPA